VILGDFNTDPSYPPGKCGDRIRNLANTGWQLAAPPADVSYWPVAGGAEKRLDHAFISKHFTVLGAEYIWESDRYIFAGKTPGAMSDHAVLMMEIELCR